MAGLTDEEWGKRLVAYIKNPNSIYKPPTIREQFKRAGVLEYAAQELGCEPYEVPALFERTVEGRVGAIRGASRTYKSRHVGGYKHR